MIRFKVKPSAQFKKDYKITIKRNLDISLLEDVIRRLALAQRLPVRNCDHALSGKLQGHRKCHIQSDWILIYRIDGDVLVLVRTGTHADLFGKQL